jgi:tetratricopeptide (TPR) repeat protein
VALLQRALQVKPDHVEALVALAAVFVEIDRDEDAEQLLLRAVAIAPESASARCQLGALLIQSSRGSEAEAQFSKALELDGNNTEALTGLGTLRLEDGLLDQSEKFYRQALNIDPANVMANFHLVQGQKILAGDPVIEQLQMLASQDKLSPMKSVSVHYARGKVLDDLGQYHEAFEEYLKGASIKRGLIHYDAAEENIKGRRIAEAVDSAFLERMQGAGDPTHKPIFVLGMPRSGTTLTEQIIASHSQVYGAGELGALLEVAAQPPLALSHQALRYPESLRALTPNELTRWGKDYLAKLPKASHSFARVTDKMPSNYYALGLIAAMLPNAKIIHVRRDPIDTCVSCFTRLFGHTQNGSYDLAELGRQYATYARLMEHWRTLLPGRFLEVQYEDIVADVEREARNLISYCALPWEDACLAFHKTKRGVRTASVLQVRQPIYSSSVQRWRRVEKYLAPLIDALGEYAPRK